ncbi:MAG: hypothetical protein AB7G93_12205 [Bdellovibrionales bacterium]
MSQHVSLPDGVTPGSPESPEALRYFQIYRARLADVAHFLERYPIQLLVCDAKAGSPGRPLWITRPAYLNLASLRKGLALLDLHPSASHRIPLGRGLQMEIRMTFVFNRYHEELASISFDIYLEKISNTSALRQTVSQKSRAISLRTLMDDGAVDLGTVLEIRQGSGRDEKQRLKLRLI